MLFMHYWWLMIPGMILGIYAQIKLSSTYNKYIQIGTESGLTGAQAAREILDHADLTNVPIEEVGGHLTDHYDPTKKALFLSSENYHGNSIAAVGVAAHESGHALQHKASYAPLQLRMAIVPISQFASYAWQGIVIAGFIFHAFFYKFLGAAIAVFSILTLFQVVTLPVEFDASRRAKQQLVRLGLVRGEEAVGVSKVLNAAALTYVAGMVAAVFQLLQLLLMARDRD